MFTHSQGSTGEAGFHTRKGNYLIKFKSYLGHTGVNPTWDTPTMLY